VFFLTVNGKIDLRDRITQSANIQLTSQQAWRSLLRFNYYGDYWLAHLGDPSLTFEPAEKVTLDAELAYTFGCKAEYLVIVGAENMYLFSAQFKDVNSPPCFC
jgi:hypothetical protein